MNASVKGDSLKKRYSYKLISNFLSLVMGFAAASIVPRALGPQAFGSYNFLTDFFNKLVLFFNMGFSDGLYVKLSKRLKEYGLLLFYFYFAIAVAGLILLLLLATLFNPLHMLIWPDQLRLFICLGAGWGILNGVMRVIGQVPDAYGFTVQAELVRVGQRAFFLVLLVSLFLTNQLNLTSYFIYQLFFLGSLSMLFVWLVYRNGHRFLAGGPLTREQIRSYSQEFYKYCHPFFLTASVGLGAGLLDRWLLQVFGGNQQQGFYGFSFSISTLCFLFTGAMQPLFMREVSIAHGEMNLEKMAALFRRHVPLLYAVAAYFSCFVAVQAHKVIYLFGGTSYEAAALPIAIMAFYPLHQTYGQLNGSVFLATEQTRIYNKISLFFTVIGVPMTFYLLAPAGFHGLGAGAEGLAVKMVVVQILACNIQLFFISRYLTLSFWKYVTHQVFSAGALFILALSSAYIADTGLNLRGMPLASFVVSGIIYTGFASAAARLFPQILGLTKQDITSLIGIVLGKFKIG